MMSSWILHLYRVITVWILQIKVSWVKKSASSFEKKKKKIPKVQL